MISAISKNDAAWEQLFAKYSILDEIVRNGLFAISADQIREFREPRLMAKFDHRINLPHVFAKNDLAILPVSRGTYCISHFASYLDFPEKGSRVRHFRLPDFIQTINPGKIPSEAIALNAALAAGIVSDFTGETILSPTVSGRMGSGCFDFRIWNSRLCQSMPLGVNNAQIEIDAALESPDSLLLIEAKLDVSRDFIIRQLFYPLRIWSSRVTKKVRPVFLLYSNSIFHLYEYEFTDLYDYNSIQLKQYGRYSIEDTTIVFEDVMGIVNDLAVCEEPEIPFPQADDFTRIINLCELLYDNDTSRENITLKYAFNARQTNYYTDAGRYLGVMTRVTMWHGEVLYQLTDKGRAILELPYKQRQLAFCEAILRHKVFRDAFIEGLHAGRPLDKKAIVSRMKLSALYNIGSESTYTRRASTIRCWLEWMASLWQV